MRLFLTLPLCSAALLACHAPLPDAEVVRPGTEMPVTTPPSTTDDAGQEMVVDAGEIEQPSWPDAGMPDAGPPPRRNRVDGQLWSRTADERGFDDFTRTGIELNERGELVLGSTGTLTATDPSIDGGYQGGYYYNGGDYRYGSATSPAMEFPEGANVAIPSFDAVTPPGTWITVKITARIDGSWSRNYILGVWASDRGTVAAHSVKDQLDGNADVATDTLQLLQRADALKINVVLFSENENTPSIRALAFTGKMAGVDTLAGASQKIAWGTVLDVPERSMMGLPNARNLFSPAVTSTLLSYWESRGYTGLAEPISTTSDRVYDWILNGYDNWTFNMAYAATRGRGRFHAFVTRLSSFSQIEPLIAAGVPVAINVRWGMGVGGPLDGAPFPIARAHFVVIRGFANNGDVVVNDPGFPSDGQVRVTYKREQLANAWKLSDRTTYIIYPKDVRLPKDPLGGY